MNVERVFIDGAPIDAWNRPTLLARYVESLEGESDVLFVGFYAALLRQSALDGQYLADLAGADVSYPDGAGAVLALRLLGGHRSVERLSTTDIWRDVVAIGSDLGRSFAVVASDDASLQVLLAEMREAGGTIVYARNGYFESAEVMENVAESVRESGADVVFVGLGSGRQERFARVAMSIEAASGTSQVFFTIGGLADHVSKRTSRAPLFVQRAGLEWLWRTAQEPRRLFRRYLYGNGYFLYRLLRQYLRQRIGLGL